MDPSDKSSCIQLHAFADASRRALAGTVFSRVVSGDGEIMVSLLMAKIRLASIKGIQPQARTTISRMELRAALLTAKLLHYLASQLNIPISDCLTWSDSQIVLYWLQKDGSTGRAYVDGYIDNIQKLLPSVTWRNVSTSSNPTDLATRGIGVKELNSSDLWWSGPSCLTKPAGDWPPNPTPEVSNLPVKEKSKLRCFAMQTNPSDLYSIELFSDLNRLLQAVVRCKRLFRRFNRRIEKTAVKPLDPITTREFKEAFVTCVILSQRQDFQAEIQRVQRGHLVKDASSLRTLAPFLDEAGVFRVGGRIQHSSLFYEEKHPVIVDSKRQLAKMIIRWAHLKGLHGGFRTRYVQVIKRAWIIGARSAIRIYVNGCAVCVRTNARPPGEIMAKLPKARVTPSRPFRKSGVDYAGPFSILRRKGRGMTTTKKYVAPFVCLSTKAIHLELAGDLYTDCLLAALSRFSGRRGPPKEIWSDNGTNFRGADNELRRLLRAAELDWGQVEGQLAKDGITWKFIPPASPHFGGLYESNVKSTKAHLQQVVGPRKLVYEEFNILLIKIESILGSRHFRAT